MAPSKNVNDGDPPDDGGQRFSAQQLNPIQEQVNGLHQIRQNPFAAIGSLNVGLRDPSNPAGPHNIAINFVQPQSQDSAQAHAPAVPTQVGQPQTRDVSAPAGTTQEGPKQTAKSVHEPIDISGPRVQAIPLQHAMARVHAELRARDADGARSLEGELKAVSEIEENRRKREAKEKADAAEKAAAEEATAEEEGGAHVQVTKPKPKPKPKPKTANGQAASSEEGGEEENEQEEAEKKAAEARERAAKIAAKKKKTGEEEAEREEVEAKETAARKGANKNKAEQEEADSEEHSDSAEEEESDDDDEYVEEPTTGANDKRNVFATHGRGKRGGKTKQLEDKKESDSNSDTNGGGTGSPDDLKSGAPHKQTTPSAEADGGDNSKAEDSSSTGSRRSMRLKTPKRNPEIRSSNEKIKRGSGVFGGGGYTEVEDSEKNINDHDPEQLMRDEKRKVRQQSESGSARGSTASFHDKHKPRRPSRLQNQLVVESSPEKSDDGDEVSEGDGEEVPSNLGSSDQEDSGRTSKKRKASSNDEIKHPAADEHQQDGSNGKKRIKRSTSADDNAQHHVKHKKAKLLLQLVAEEDSDSDSDSDGLEASYSEPQLTIDEPDALGADGSGHVDLTDMPAFDEQDEPATSSQGSPDETEPVETPADDPDTQRKRKMRDGQSRTEDGVRSQWHALGGNDGVPSSTKHRPNQVAQPQQSNNTQSKGKGHLQDTDDDEAPGRTKNKKRKPSAAPWIENEGDADRPEKKKKSKKNGGDKA